MNTRISTVLRFIAITFLLFLPNIAQSEITPPDSVHPDVAALIQAGEAPEGVVFDIETLDKNALNELTAFVVKQVELVKDKYPDVDVAIVSHGTEEYALQQSAQKEYAPIHDMFNQLVSTKEVSVHVCGAVAGLKGLSQEDFPDFVSYSESGMAQINDYKALDYVVIVIKQLDDKQRKALFETPEKYIN